jgi:diguanylate cyclase (GGDEF)-like protein
VDSSLLPEIFSLIVFIIGFQPLVRRVGAHANLWFLGWFFLLVNEITVLISTIGGDGWFTQLIAALVLALCGLSFLAAAANSAIHPGSPTSNDQRIDPQIMAELIVPVLLGTAICVLHVANLALGMVLAVLYLVPVAHMMVRRERRRRVLAVGIAFGLFGLISAPFLVMAQDWVRSAVLCLVFWSAAALYEGSMARMTRGNWAATIGLITGGISYPLHMLLQQTWPSLHLQRSIFLLPEYLILAGISLTLLEEHVLRTERLANHDPLTDLPNRRMFEERLIATMEEARVERTTVACLVIDIDNFKMINDTLGHSAGDQLLRALAVRLSWHMSPRDILARTGGDEFTALLAGVRDEHHLRFIAGAMMSAASVPVMIDGKPVDVRISVGIALSPDHADDIDSLRRAADEAMYSAKRRGGSLLAFAGEED